MDIRFRIFIIFVIALIAAAVWSFPVWWPYVRPGDDIPIVFEGLDPDLQTSFLVLPEDVQDAFYEMREADPAMATALVTARLSEPTQTSLDPDSLLAIEELPMIRSGRFIGVPENFTDAGGTATVYQRADGNRVLLLRDFRVTNGPALHVIFARDPQPMEGSEVGVNYIDLGLLEAAQGTQVYDVPEAVNFSIYQSIVIYQPEYGIVFAVAAIS